MKKKIIVIGGKGSAVVVAEQIIDAERKGLDAELLGFAFDDDSYGNEINGISIISKTSELRAKFDKFSDIHFIFQLYRPDLMQQRIALLNSYQIPLNRFYTFIHPSAIISPSSKIGLGCSILANCVINSNVEIGNHCTIHSNSLIGHDSKMNDYNFFAAHSVLGSNNRIGYSNFIGLNSTFNNYLNIGDNCFVGMASNVTKNIKSNTKVYGNPAKEFISKIKPL